jgi:hypothetical protein
MAQFDMPKTGPWEVRGGWVVRRLAADLDLPLPNAAGVVGNLGYESAGFTKLQEIRPLVRGSRGGFGWAQWTGPRRDRFEEWCAAHDLEAVSDEANYGFLIEELRGTYHGIVTDPVRRCAGIEDACRLVHRFYETPSDVLDGSYRSGPDRLQWARRALAGAGAPDAPVAYNRAGAARDMQVALARLGLYTAAVDGIWGPLSRAAYERFVAG